MLIVTVISGRKKCRFASNVTMRPVADVDARVFIHLRAFVLAEVDQKIDKH